MSLMQLIKDDSYRRAYAAAARLAEALCLKNQEVLVASTGIIGLPLPVGRIKKAIPRLAERLSASGLPQVAAAILTTDTFIKLSSLSMNIGKGAVRIFGLAKGAGMIAPDLSDKGATMLCFILSDANIRQGALKAALREAADSSFNCITVDGCMSTNDSLLMMSNACADNPVIKQGSGDYHKFASGLRRVCLDLAKMIVRDAEGASKFIQIKITQARTSQEARRVALSIANSNLFKSALFGGNRNFGRIVAAIGASGVDVKEKSLKIKLSPLNRRDIYLEASLKRGRAQATVYTADLSPEYVKINASYS